MYDVLSHADLLGLLLGTCCGMQLSALRHTAHRDVIDGVITVVESTVIQTLSPSSGGTSPRHGVKTASTAVRLGLMQVVQMTQVVPCNRRATAAEAALAPVQ